MYIFDKSGNSLDASRSIISPAEVVTAANYPSKDYVLEINPAADSQNYSVENAFKKSLNFGNKFEDYFTKLGKFLKKKKNMI